MSTLEGSPEVANIARQTLKMLNVSNTKVVVGPFSKTLVSVLKESSPIDFFFNDGHHDRDAVLEYWNFSISYLAEKAIVVFDDISWSPGMRDAWVQICQHENVSFSLDLHTIGIVLVDKMNTDMKKNHVIPIRG